MGWNGGFPLYMAENKWASLRIFHPTFRGSILGFIFSSCCLEKKPSSKRPRHRSKFACLSAWKSTQIWSSPGFPYCAVISGRISEWREWLGQNYSSYIFFDFNSDPKQIGCWKRSVITRTFFGGWTNQLPSFLTSKRWHWKLRLVDRKSVV